MVKSNPLGLESKNQQEHRNFSSQLRSNQSSLKYSQNCGTEYALPSSATFQEIALSLHISRRFRNLMKRLLLPACKQMRNCSQCYSHCLAVFAVVVFIASFIVAEEQVLY